MKIIIMRHGQPDMPELPEKIRSSEFQACLDIYNQCGLSAASRPGPIVLEEFSDIQAIVASDLKRSMESASVLSGQLPLIIDPVFREVEDAFIAIPFFRFTPGTWGKLFILLWFAGLFEIKPSVKEAKLRAAQGARKLIDLAEARGPVLFVGHGFINTYIAKELNALGWRGPRIPGKRYWEYGVYEK